MRSHIGEAMLKLAYGFAEFNVPSDSKLRAMISFRTSGVDKGAVDWQHDSSPDCPLGGRSNEELSRALVKRLLAAIPVRPWESRRIAPRRLPWGPEVNPSSDFWQECPTYNDCSRWLRFSPWCVSLPGFPPKMALERGE